MTAVIELRGVAKRFRCQTGSGQRTVLHDIDLTVGAGESVAILGQNGAGKSVLLKLITSIYEPTVGEVVCRERAAALIELGAGFHPERDGRSNLRAAFALQGLATSAARRASEVAEAFSGLDPADLERPIKHYSSGMLARLGFAFVVACEPQVLISDEVLAVGDDAFQRKCIAWLEGYVAGGGTLLLVSHNLYHVQKLCDRAVWLHDGRVRQDGDVFAVAQDYLAWHEAKLGVAHEHGQIVITDTAGRPGHQLPQGQVAYVAFEDAAAAPTRMSIARLSGEIVYDAALNAAAGPYRMPTEHLLPGRYIVGLHSAGGDELVARSGFRIAGRSRLFGSVDLERQWI